MYLGASNAYILLMYALVPETYNAQCQPKTRKKMKNVEAYVSQKKKKIQKKKEKEKKNWRMAQGNGQLILARNPCNRFIDNDATDRSWTDARRIPISLLC